jgi:energy-coupling factor transport system ATP-binding protein
MQKITKSEKALQKEFMSQIKAERKAKKKFNYSGDIVLENVSYTYSKNSPFEFRALDNANLTLSAGIITCVIGTTGSGKSTMVQLTNGLLTTETGRTIIGDYQIPASMKKIKEVKELRKEIGLVFQFPEYQLFQDTIEKDISFGPINMGGNKQEALAAVPRLLELVQLPADYLTRSPFELSGGQKRRVAIAGIIAMDGNTLVLDEPTGGLDPQGEDDFMKLFKRLNTEEGKRIIMVTHNMDQVLKIADQVVVLHEGKLIAKGTPFEIFSNQKMLEKIEIEPPKLYRLMYKLKEQGIDIIDKQVRSVEDFAREYRLATTKE